MVNYSKKQINPLVEKYSIDVESNMYFQSIITMFDNATNYQIWAIKLVFEGVVTIEVLQSIKQWIDNNQNDIKNLVKGNVILYKTKADIQMLFDEFRGLDILNYTRASINRFNTAQRKMMMEVIAPKSINSGLDALSSRTIKSWYELFKKIETLPKHRQEKLISTSSALNDLTTLHAHILNALNETYEWNKDDMLGYMARNCKDCSVVHNVGDVVVAQIGSFDSAQKLCGGGRTGWCLTREERYFRQYVSDVDGAAQFFVFNFGLKEDHNLAHIGFTVQRKGITNAHSTLNNNMMGDGAIVKGRDGRVNIHQALRELNIPSNVYIRLKELKNFIWDVEAFLKYVKKSSSSVEISYADNNRIIVAPKTNDMLQRICEHTLVDFRTINISSASKTFVLLDFNLDVNDENSIVFINFAKDQYGFESLSKMINAFNVNIIKDKYLDQIGIKTNMFLKRDSIDPSILLHKLIDEGSESEAIELIKENGKNVNVNYEFNNLVPIFKTINRQMYNLFELIVNTEGFDCSTSDECGESLLQSLMYTFRTASTNDQKVQLTRLIEIILNSSNFDFNVQNINLDTALSVAAESPELCWVVEKLIADPNVNVNVINDVMRGALGNAIVNNNVEAIKLLGTRPDLVVRQEDIDLAKKHGISDLNKYIQPKPFSSHAFEPTKKTTKDVVTVDDDKMSSLAEIFASVLSMRK